MKKKRRSMMRRIVPLVASLAVAAIAMTVMKRAMGKRRTYSGLRGNIERMMSQAA